MATEGTIRVGLAQMNPRMGDLDGNVAAMLATYREADEADCDVVVFGELSVSGYPPEDLVLKAGFVADNRAALDRFVAATGRAAAVVGFVDRDGEALYNAAAVCSGGRLHGIYRKHRLPNYRVFDEERYFEPGDESPLWRVAGAIVGVTICEDVWVDDGPVRTQAAAGASVVLNINGSPYSAGRGRERAAMLSERARTNRCAIVYVNQAGGQDELVFDGGSMVVDGSGTVVARAESFREQLLVVDVPSTLAESAPAAKLIEVSDRPRTRRGDVTPTMAPELDEMEEIRRALVLGTRDYVHKNGFTDVVIGLSGGIDSALVAAIAVDAFGAERVHGVAMPSRYSSEGSRTDASRLASNLGIDLRTIEIERAHSAFLAMLEPSFVGRDEDLTEENLQSRIRGTTLMSLSNKFGWMVLTTGNKSELAVGYFTLYGDSVGGYAVIRDLLKTRVYRLCEHVNERAGREVIPRTTIDKPPSAELRPDQRDDQSLPPYEVLDPILEMYVEHDLTASEIVAVGHDAELVGRITRLVDVNEYKRRQGPPGPRITTKAFGKDRRLPITNRYRG